MKPYCVAVLGGSFDPVHNGHVALGTYFASQLEVDELRVIPAGDPWQKSRLCASSSARKSMVELAFQNSPFVVNIDSQELDRSGPTYSIDTLQALRDELGPTTSIALLIGADQLLHLNTWHRWSELFNYAHICVASRPGFAIDIENRAGRLCTEIEQEFSRRLSTAQEIKSYAHGCTLLANDLAINISASTVRALLEAGERPYELVPTQVLDYIERHNLYKKT